MKKAMIAVAALAATGTATAGPAWTYIDLGYIQSSTAEAVGTEDSTGYDLAGSIGFGDMWHAQASWGNQETDSAGGGSLIDVDVYELRAGVHPAITDNTDFVADIGYTKWDVNGGGKPDAYDIRIGVRSMLADNFEVNATLAAQSGDLDASGTDFDNLIPTVGGQYFFSDNISVNLEYSWGGTQDVVVGSKDAARFGVRWSF